VWTGEYIIAWSGGETGPSAPVTGGVAYHLADNRWRELPEAPLTARTSHSSVWTGSEVIYWGGRRGFSEPNTAFADGAAFNPATNTWRMVSAAPIGPRFAHEAVWTGTEMIVWGGLERCCPIDSVIHDTAAAAYNPVTDTWRRLPDVPAPWSGDGGPAIVAAVGSDMLVWRGNRLGRFDVAANAWRDLGSPPSRPDNCMSTGGPGGVGALLGEQFYVWSGGCKATFGAVFNVRSGVWSALPDAPSPNPNAGPERDPFFNQLASITAAGNRLLALGGQSTAAMFSFDARTRTWSKGAEVANVPGDGPFVAWTGSELLVWGGFNGPGSVRGGAAYRPTS
jgi:hypothetical protein